LAAIVRLTNANSSVTRATAVECGAFRVSDFGFVSRFCLAEPTMGAPAAPSVSIEAAAGP
jgi:hypothetical protein